MKRTYPVILAITIILLSSLLAQANTQATRNGQLNRNNQETNIDAPGKSQQLATLVWARSYGGSGTDTANMVIPTSDGGYIVAGSPSSFGLPNDYAWILKLTSFGNV